MRKLSCFLIIAFMLLLSSCSDNPAEKPRETTLPSPSPVASTGDAGGIELEKLGIADIDFTELSSEQSADYNDKKFIEEFRSFIVNQDYGPAQNDWSSIYTVRMRDSEGKDLLEITLGEKNVSFDRDVTFRGGHFAKGTVYETGEWINEYIFNFAGGNVLEPVLLTFPAKLRIPLEYYTAETVNKGSGAVHRYETVAGLHDFVERSFAGKEFEITGGERLYGEEARRAEEARQAGARVIRIDCQSGDSYLRIDSPDAHDELIVAYSLSLYRDGGDPGCYRLAGGGEVLLLKVDKAFDSAFQELFDGDDASKLRLDARGVEEVFKQKKPWYLDYICANLGMGLWNRREDVELGRDRVKLDSGAYTVLTIESPVDSRLMFFDGRSGTYIDYIDFGGRESGTSFDVERAGGYSWIAGNRSAGHGTGVSLSNREYYTLGKGGRKLALSIPYDSYEVGPNGGNVFKAERLRFEGKDPVRLIVDYAYTRIYMLDIEGADEYGQVKLESTLETVFEWNAGLGIFTSQYSTDEQGRTYITAGSAEITKKCGELLEKNYDRLRSDIEALDGLENELNRSYKAGAYEEFLRDCPDGAKKAALTELLKDKSKGQPN